MDRNCIVERQKTVRHSTLNIVTGETTTKGEPTIVVEPCNTPIFGKGGFPGVCSACADLWEHPENTITPQGLAQIIAASEPKGPLDVARALMSSPRLRGK